LLPGAVNHACGRYVGCHGKTAFNVQLIVGNRQIGRFVNTLLTISGAGIICANVLNNVRDTNTGFDELLKLFLPYHSSNVRMAWVSVLMALTVFSAGLLAPVEASAETRKLKLYFLHTGERAEITFKKNGRYVSSGLKKINRFLRDWRRNEPTKMDPRLLDLIWEVYKETGSRKPIHVISAYRSPATNSLLRKRGRGVAKKSQHVRGKALDFFIPGVSLKKLRYIGLRKGLGGVGYYPKSGSPFVHMDTGSVRHWPKMSRSELARVFPKGKTLHVPSDGKPLARYNQAKAEYNRKIKGGSKIVIAKAEDTEKKPRLLAKLLGRGDADEEGAVGAVSAPKTVRTSTKPEKKPEPATPAVAPVAVPEPVQPEIVAEPETPETILAALPVNTLPIPAVAPRIASEPVLPVPAVVEPIEPAATAVPLPEAPIPVNEVPDSVLARLEQEIVNEQPAEEEEEPLVLAYAVIPTPAPRVAAVIPEITETVETEPEEALQAPEVLALVNVPQPSEPVRVAALSPSEIEDLRSQVYSVLEKDIRGRKPVQTDTVVTEASIPQPDIKLAFVPQPNPRRKTETAIQQRLAGIALNNAETPIQEQISTEEVVAGIPVPVPAVRSVTVASNDTKDLNAVKAGSKKLGKWALAADASIEKIADINPPAYARNVIRERPASVLARGFVVGKRSQSTEGFSGSSIEFLDFRRFQ